MGFKHKTVLLIALGVILYVAIGNARILQYNPFIQGATVAINMIVPVLFGILYGRVVGGLVGLIGTALNALSPAGNQFEYASILPHFIMGVTAGSLPDLRPSIAALVALLTGHILNIVMFIVFGLMPIIQLSTAGLWLNLVYELLSGVLIVTILIAVYRLDILEEKKHFLD